MVEIDLQYFRAKWRRLSQEDRLELLFWFNAHVDWQELGRGPISTQPNSD